MSARSLRLIESPNTVPTAKRLRAAIIEGTLGDDVGPYPPMPESVQRVVEKRLRELANEACNLIRESITRQIGNQCFTGASYEFFDADGALEIAISMTLDDALAPIVRQNIKSIRIQTEAFVAIAKSMLKEVDRSLMLIDARAKS